MPIHKICCPKLSPISFVQLKWIFLGLFHVHNLHSIDWSFCNVPIYAENGKKTEMGCIDSFWADFRMNKDCRYIWNYLLFFYLVSSIWIKSNQIHTKFKNSILPIWFCTSNSVFLRVVVTNSPQLIKVCDLNRCHGNQTQFWTLPYMVATESPTVIAFKWHN